MDFLRLLANGLFVLFCTLALLVVLIGLLMFIFYIAWWILPLILIVLIALYLGDESDFGEQRGKWFWEGWFKK